MAHEPQRVCAGCRSLIHRYDDYIELSHNQFYHWSCEAWYVEDYIKQVRERHSQP